jgi:hypothetical protein
LQIEEMGIVSPECQSQRRRPADWCCNEATSAASDHDEEVAEFHVTIIGAVNNSTSISGTL